MDMLIEKLVTDDLSPLEERRLVKLHQSHFSRRVSQLDPVFVPGREKTKDGIESLGNEAYASFCSEKTIQGRPAFHHAFKEGLPPAGFLYYWRNSATIQFLRRVGDTSLHGRLKVLRNVRIHLRRDFKAVGQRYGQSLWAPKATKLGRDPQHEVDVDDIAHRLDTARGAAAIRQIFELAQVALTRAEIAAVLFRKLGEPTGNIPFEPIDTAVFASTPARAEAAVLTEEARARAHQFWKELDEEEQQLLATRGYGRGQEKLTPHRRVAELLPRRSSEGWRLIELSILRRFAERFSERWEADAALEVIRELAGGIES